MTPNSESVIKTSGKVLPDLIETKMTSILPRYELYICHKYQNHFWFIHNTDAIFLLLTRSVGGEGYAEAVGEAEL